MICPVCGIPREEGKDICQTDWCRFDFTSHQQSPDPNSPEETIFNPKLTPSFQSGDTIADKYLIRRILGRGGMGSVYQVSPMGIDITYALKVLHPVLAQDRELVERFKQEVIKGVSLDHPNIIRVHEYHEWQGYHFFTMQYLQGQSLDRLLKSKGEKIPPLGVDTSVRIMDQILSALSHAHESGIIHRDIKPANIMVMGEGPDIQVKVLDFGIARALSPSRFENSAQAEGTLFYVAPEQSKGIVDARSDLFSAGALFYQMLTGDVPAGFPMLPSDLVPGIPLSIDDFLKKALSPKPENRHESAREMKADLTALEMPQGEAAAESHAPKDPEPPEPDPPKSPRPGTEVRPGLMITLALILICILGYFGINAFVPGGSGSGGTVETKVDRAPVKKNAVSQDLTYSYGILRIESQPSGAAVYIDGKNEGTAPLTLDKIRTGSHRIKVSMACRKTVEVSVKVEPRQEVFRTIDLPPACGSIKVSGSPSGASLFLDGKAVGTLPKLLEGVSEGVRTIRVEKSGYKPLEKRVPVTAGGASPFELNLETSGPEVVANWTEPETGMEFVYVPAGCFDMGSNSDGSDEKPVHKVCLDGFWMGKYEVTNRQYRQFKSGHSSGSYNGEDLNGDIQPVVKVSWEDAQAFLSWLNKKSSHNFALPSEAQWEYAARGGTTTMRFWGDDADQACGHANVYDQTSKQKFNFDWAHHNCNDGYAVAAPVGRFNPNGFGLYDMLGNVWEWCEDVHDANAYSKPEHGRKNPLVTFGGSNRVRRGGGWSSKPADVRCANRRRFAPSNSCDILGFRLIRKD